MSNYETSMKTGHPVLGIILGILGILVAALLCLLVGVPAGVAAGILGLVAILLGVKARKGGKGIGAIIFGALAVLLAIVMTTTSITFYKTVHEIAVAQGNMPLLEKYTDNPYFGLAGMIVRVSAEDAEHLEAFQQELEQATSKMNTTTTTTTTVENGVTTVTQTVTHTVENSDGTVTETVETVTNP